MNSVLAILIGLMSGAAMSVAVSSVWCVLHLPARIQHLLHAASPRMMGLALLSGLMLAALHNALRWTLGLPGVFGVVAMVVGGMFVGMVASALGEILEVAPARRAFRIHSQIRSGTHSPIKVTAGHPASFLPSWQSLRRFPSLRFSGIS